MGKSRDPSLDTLLDLDGQVLVVDPAGGHWVKFVVTTVAASPEKPHGLDYSLTLHGPSGERLVGFDNAHPVGRQKRGEPQDHRHRLKTVSLTTTRTPAPSWPISGRRWTRCLGKEESSHDDAEGRDRRL